MNARESILNSIRSALKRDSLSAEKTTHLKQEMHNKTHNIIPARVDLSQSELEALFIDYAKKSGATLAIAADDTDIPNLVKTYLQQKNIALTVRMAESLAHLDWSAFTLAAGAAENDDIVAVTQALAAIAETGTLVCTSAKNTPTTLNFLPETSIMVLAKEAIVPAYEQAWQNIKTITPTPRSINFITGPSRTGDIEQQLLMGIHGPKYLHIILH